jgi:phosphoglycolate phosphatase-like HAD superfamily hydrolase
MLFLFDIDGTLLRRMPPAHRQAICDGLAAVYDLRTDPDDLGQTAGMTDSAIALRRLRAAGVPQERIASHLPDFFAAAADAYGRHVPADLRPYHTPHAAEALARLQAAGAALGLVTGNIGRIAWIKLRAAGLADFFRFGAFGDESEERDDLPPLARARAAGALGHSVPPEATFVVGDTPADVQCGAAHGLRTVAVATGPIHSLDELRACGPDYAFEDLRGLLALELPAHRA